jgi:murein DD-endopeptidase MepM/ murein hydrolase activator NlpD
MGKTQTPFAAASDGFEFVNFFELKLPVKFELPLVGKIDLNRVVFGLCGGMCFAALDYFHARQRLPQYPAPQDIDGPLLSYLLERQLDSLSIPVLIKILDWMARGQDELAKWMLKTELPRLTRSLDKGKPVVLCLIRVGKGGDPTHNHQVVATGYDLDVAPGKMVIHLYDPNHPLAAPTITVSLSRADFAISQSTGEELRGFFLIPYTFRKTSLPVPPPAPGEVAFEAEVPEPPFRLAWPVDSRKVNQMFGENPRTYKPFGLAGHEGIDFFAPQGAKIYASFAGTVSEARYRGAYGNQVRIRHEANGLKFTTVYAHLHKMLARPGQQVSAGDLIGLADNTGNSHGSHLHFTLFIDGRKTPGYYDGIVDPWLFFEGNEPPPPPTLSGVVVYVVKDVNLRALPTTDSEILTLLPAGEQLPVFGQAGEVKKKIGKKQEWLQVQTAGGQTGFVAAWFVADQAEQAFPPTGLIVYPFDTLPMRVSPGLGLAQVGVAGAITPLNVLGSLEGARAKLGQKDQWLQVLAPDGTRGFVPAWLVRVTGDTPPATGLFVTPTFDLNLRSAPSKEADIMAVVTPGDTLKVVGEKIQAAAKIGRQEQWLNVQVPNGMTGWVAAWLVEQHAPPAGGEETLPPPPPGATVFPIPEEGINLRGAPDVDAMRVGGAPRNEPLTLLDSDLNAARARLGQADQWVYVQTRSGRRGWAAAWFLSVTPQP